jgi:hypothetical protein
MAFPSPPHPNTRPLQGSEPLDPAGDRAFLNGWLAHVEAGRIGNNPAMSEETRAAILANERLVLGQVRSSAG